ncbi:MAG: vitamin B12 dependent-methionine synthase activation domain-containing protein [Acidobacteriota bacterium]
MREVLTIPTEAIIPKREEVMSLQGIPRDSILPEKIVDLYEKAFSIFLKTKDPGALISEISEKDLENILSHAGVGLINSVVSTIFKKSNNIALYVFTLGTVISDTISDMFDRNDFALGSMLDSIASASADRGGEYGERYFLDYLKKVGSAAPDNRVLMYSPGYCGWDITGQKKLFRYLNPGDIGVSLSESSLMTPLKSISGVLISGKKEIHYIKADFEFCNSCQSKNCIDRIKKIKQEE